MVRFSHAMGLHTMGLVFLALILSLVGNFSEGQASRMPPQGNSRKPVGYIGPFGLVQPGTRAVESPETPPAPQPPAAPGGASASPSRSPSAAAPRMARSTATGGISRRSRPTSSRVTARWETWWEWNKERFLGIGKRRRSIKMRSDLPGVFLGRAPLGKISVRDRFRQLRSDVWIPTLRMHAGDSRTALRIASMYALGFFGERELLTDLVHGLSDPDLEVREAAVAALGMARDSRAIPALEEVIKGRLPGTGDRKKKQATARVRGMAALSLGLIGDADALHVLKKTAFFQNTHREVRGSALLGLGLIPDSEARALLFRALKASWCGVTERALIATALGFQGDPEVLNPLYRLMHDRASEVRRSAVLAMGAFPRQAVLLGTLREARERMNEGDGADLTDHARDVLAVYILEVKSALDRERDAEGIVWGRIRNSLRSLLTKDADHAVRAFAAIALGQVGEIQDASLLGRQLLHGGHEIKGCSALALGLLARNHPEQNDPLIHLLRKQAGKARDPSLRGALYLALGLGGDLKMVPMIAASLKSEEAPSLRGYAATALGLLGDRQPAFMVARELARARDMEEIQNAALGLSLIGGADEVAYLKNILFSSKDTFEQIAAGSGLAFLGGGNVMESLVKFLNASTKPTPAKAFIAEGIGIASDLRDPTPLSRITIGQNFLLRIGSVARVADLKW